MLHKGRVDFFWTVANEQRKSLAVSVETAPDIPQMPGNPPMVRLTNDRPPIYRWVMGEVFRVQ